MSKRDEVAKHLCRMTCQEMSDEACGQTGCGTNWTMYRNDADAILATLADPDDRMVEAAAKAMWDAIVDDDDHPRDPSWETPTDDPGIIEAKDNCRIQAKAAIRAAMRAAGE